MLTLNDLKKCGDNEERRIVFIEQAITDFKRSDEYKIAEKATAYYRKENPDIAAVEKIIYDMQGMAHTDYVSPNHKIRNAFFPLIIDEAVSHLLANGVTFADPKKKELLGANFDDVLKKLFCEAMVCRCSYAYYDKASKRIIQLPYLNFVQVKEDYSGYIGAGIYFTQIDDTKPLTVYLYEADGYTIYVQEPGESLKLAQNKKPYVTNYKANLAEGRYEIGTENSSILPIYPLYNLNNQSSIIGNLEILIALDIMMSELCNNVSQSELVYWVLKNYGGMDDIADANFVVNLLKTHVIHVEEDGEATPHQINVPVEANTAAYVRLKSQLFENMRGVNHEVLNSGNLTATAINSAYSRLRNFSAMIESNVFDFIRGILRIAGEDDDVTFSVEYNETINPTEAIQNILASAPYLSEEAVTKKLIALNGLNDMQESILEQRETEAMERMSLTDVQNAAQDGSEGIEV